MAASPMQNTKQALGPSLSTTVHSPRMLQAQSLLRKIDAHAVVLHGQARAEASELLATGLLEVLQELGVSREDEIGEVVQHLLEADVPSRLVNCLSSLDFEVQKTAVRVVAAILRAGLRSRDEQVTNYVLGHPRFRKVLLDGCSMPGIFHHCAEILRSCIRCPRLTGALIQDGTAVELLDLAQHPSFDISSEAFFSLRELLLMQRGVASAYIQANFDEFFKLYHTVLQAEDYVTQRQALKLLAEMMLDRSYLEVMVQYVNRVEFLQIHMNFLRHSSAVIRLDAFHLFKIFVANPRKPRASCMILFRNCDRLLKLLRRMEAVCQDQTLHSDLRTVMDILLSIEPPSSQK